MIQRYPQHDSGREWRKDRSREDRREDDRSVAAQNSHTPSAPAKKDRTRWCRGKVGIEHQWERTQRVFLGVMVRQYIDVCQACGKKRYIYDKIPPESEGT